MTLRKNYSSKWSSIHFFLTRTGGRRELVLWLHQSVSDSHGGISEAGHKTLGCSAHSPSNIDLSSVVLYLQMTHIKLEAVP